MVSCFDGLFEKYARVYGLRPDWLKAICMIESSLGQDELVQKGLASRDGLSYGIMQLTLPTASDMLGRAADPKDLNDPETSVCLAARYLKFLLAMFGNDLHKAVMAYNEGPGNMRRGVQSIEAKAYYDKFRKNLQTLQRSPH